MVLFCLAIELLLLHQLYMSKGNNQKAQNILWNIACFSVWFFTAFRSFTTGNDTHGYILAFEKIKQTSWHDVIYVITYRDPFFIWFVKLCTVILRTPRVYLAFTAFLSYIGVFILFKRKAKLPILALFFYVTLANFLFNLSGIRQAIAMSLCLVAVLYIEKRNLYLFCLFVLLGMIFHHSAAIFFPCYFLCQMKASPKILLLYILGAVVGIVCFERILGVANEYLNYNYGVEEIDSGKYYFLILVAIFVITYSKKEEWSKINGEQELFVLLTICVCLWAFRLVGRIAERPSMYFLGAMPVSWTNAMALEKSVSRRKLYFLGGILIALLLFLKRVYSFPYQLF